MSCKKITVTGTEQTRGKIVINKVKEVAAGVTYPPIGSTDHG